MGTKIVTEYARQPFLPHVDRGSGKEETRKPELAPPLEKDVVDLFTILIPYRAPGI
jgi:hypothetical protein